MNSPSSVKIDEFRSNAYIATGEPEMRWIVIPSSSLMFQRLCRITSYVIGSILSVPSRWSASRGSMSSVAPGMYENVVPSYGPVVFELGCGRSAMSVPSKVDQHVAVRIDARRLERVHDDRRVRRLDDRRSGNHVAGLEALAPEDRGRLEIPELGPVDGARAGARLRGRRAIHIRRRHDPRLRAHRRSADAIRHDLHARLPEPGAAAVDGLVATVEVFDEAGERDLVERAGRDGHLDLVDLALVAKVGRAREPRRARVDAVGAELGVAP